VLLYSLEACRLNKAQIKSLNFLVFSGFSKIFNTRSSDIVTHCMQIFDCDNIESILQKKNVRNLCGNLPSAPSVMSLVSLLVYLYVYFVHHYLYLCSLPVLW